ncbi:hypothetical protein Cob_v001374 [Colletotrichum orbiculare MAFF 240422]|uniref:Uncharacterized protein n=1 Tax=Colletotrichum orbiculare (strain 104-T / ATCC 96160 / CBS 514.97 / LARS 414 / MAFF 240422) TaxID=1213857 RepID=A0A484G7T8_COLOR|nr:hypothetical protein Cob_v001374 [Colletotrichum orbiculare MAFF 240422]
MRNIRSGGALGALSALLWAGLADSECIAPDGQGFLKQRIVVVDRVPVQLSASLCSNTTITVAGTTVPVTNAPTLLVSNFFVDNTITYTSTLNPSLPFNGPFTTVTRGVPEGSLTSTLVLDPQGGDNVGTKFILDPFFTEAQGPSSVFVTGPSSNAFGLQTPFPGRFTAITAPWTGMVTTTLLLPPEGSNEAGTELVLIPTITPSPGPFSTLTGMWTGTVTSTVILPPAGSDTVGTQIVLEPTAPGRNNLPVLPALFIERTGTVGTQLVLIPATTPPVVGPFTTVTLPGNGPGTTTITLPPSGPGTAGTEIVFAPLLPTSPGRGPFTGPFTTISVPTTGSIFSTATFAPIEPDTTGTEIVFFPDIFRDATSGPFTGPFTTLTAPGTGTAPTTFTLPPAGTDGTGTQIVVPPITARPARFLGPVRTVTLAFFGTVTTTLTVLPAEGDNTGTLIVLSPTPAPTQPAPGEPDPADADPDGPADFGVLVVSSDEDPADGGVVTTTYGGTVTFTSTFAPGPSGEPGSTVIFVPSTSPGPATPTPPVNPAILTSTYSGSLTSTTTILPNSVGGSTVTIILVPSTVTVITTVQVTTGLPGPTSGSPLDNVITAKPGVNLHTLFLTVCYWYKHLYGPFDVFVNQHRYYWNIRRLEFRLEFCHGYGFQHRLQLYLEVDLKLFHSLCSGNYIIDFGHSFELICPDELSHVNQLLALLVRQLFCSEYGQHFSLIFCYFILRGNFQLVNVYWKHFCCILRQLVCKLICNVNAKVVYRQFHIFCCPIYQLDYQLKWRIFSKLDRRPDFHCVCQFVKHFIDRFGFKCLAFKCDIQLDYQFVIQRFVDCFIKQFYSQLINSFIDCLVDQLFCQLFIDCQPDKLLHRLFCEQLIHPVEQLVEQLFCRRQLQHVAHIHVFAQQLVGYHDFVIHSFDLITFVECQFHLELVFIIIGELFTHGRDLFRLYRRPGDIVHFLHPFYLVELSYFLHLVHPFYLFQFLCLVELTSTFSGCVVTTTATAAAQCGASLPGTCAQLPTTNGLLPLTATAASCLLDLGPFGVGPVALCLTTNLNLLDPRGAPVADCLLTALRASCPQTLPQVCLDLRVQNGVALLANIPVCAGALGPYSSGAAAICLALNSITSATTGLSVFGCLQNSFNLVPSVTTITDPSLCPGPTAPPSPVPTCVTPPLPGQCLSLATGSVIDLVLNLPACTAALGGLGNIVGVATCVAGNLLSGLSVVTCLQDNLRANCIRTLPQVCLDLSLLSGTVDTALCVNALGPLAVGPALACLTSGLTSGPAIVQCLNRALFT